MVEKKVNNPSADSQEQPDAATDQGKTTPIDDGQGEQPLWEQYGFKSADAFKESFNSLQSAYTQSRQEIADLKKEKTDEDKKIPIPPYDEDEDKFVAELQKKPKDTIIGLVKSLLEKEINPIKEQTETVALDVKNKEFNSILANAANNDGLSPEERKLVADVMAKEYGVSKIRPAPENALIFYGAAKQTIKDYLANAAKSQGGKEMEDLKKEKEAAQAGLKNPSAPIPIETDSDFVERVEGAVKEYDPKKVAKLMVDKLNELV